MLVSVIVPVYNASQYIEKCVESIIGQTYSKIELILVNDGSQDDSLDKCILYANRYANIKVINQNNQGCSAARNAGFLNATGDYFMFVDADDSLSESVIQDLVEVTSKNQADVAIGTVNKSNLATKQSVTVDGNIACKICINKQKYVSEYQLPGFMEDINPSSPWMKLIRKSLYNEDALLFESDIKTHHEDTLFCFQLYNMAGKIVYVDSSPYIYNLNAENSLTKKFFDDKLQEAQRLLEYMNHYIDNSNLGVSERETLKNEFGVEIIMECWADYFTHVDKNNLSRHEISSFLESDEIERVINNVGQINTLKPHQKLVWKAFKRKCSVMLLCLAKIQKLLRG